MLQRVRAAEPGYDVGRRHSRVGHVPYGEAATGDPIGTPAPPVSYDNKDASLHRPKQLVEPEHELGAPANSVRTCAQSMVRISSSGATKVPEHTKPRPGLAYPDRKSTRLNSSHGYISYA